MDRRSVAETVFASILTLGGGAAIAALPLPDGSPYTTALVATGAVMAVVGLVGLIGLMLFPAKRPTSDRKEAGGVATQTKTQTHGAIDQSVTSFNQMGGITAHTLNFAPPRRILDNDAGNDLLRKIPEDRVIQVECVHGDAEADQFAWQIWDFLNRSGRPMAGRGPDYFLRAPPAYGQKIDLNRDPSVACITIGTHD